MANLKNKVESLIQALERSLGKVGFPTFMPPPTSADPGAAIEVASRNSEIVAGAVLGLHGPPDDGGEVARRLMVQFVDWNEVRVASPVLLVRVLGKDPRAGERIQLLQRFLEAFFLKQRNLNLEHLVGLKSHERRQFVSDLEVFNREELSAFLLTCFGHAVFPPADPVHRVAQRCGLIRAKTTVLQMVKLFEDSLEIGEMLSLYAHLYAIALKVCHPESPRCPQCTLRSRCPSARKFAKAARN